LGIIEKGRYESICFFPSFPFSFYGIYSKIKIEKAKEIWVLLKKADMKVSAFFHLFHSHFRVFIVK